MLEVPLNPKHLPPPQTNSKQLSTPLQPLITGRFPFEGRKTSMKKLFLYLLFAALTSAFLVAQDTSPASKSKGDVRTITGCLAQGDSSKEFVLKADDGSTWEL